MTYTRSAHPPGRGEASRRPHPPREQAGTGTIAWYAMLSALAAAIGVVLGLAAFPTEVVLPALFGAFGCVFLSAISLNKPQLWAVVVAALVGGAAWSGTHLLLAHQPADVSAHTTINGKRTATARKSKWIPLKVTKKPAGEQLMVVLDVEEGPEPGISCVKSGQLEFTGKGLKDGSKPAPLKQTGPTEVVLDLATHYPFTLHVELTGAPDGCQVELTLLHAEFR